MSPLTITLLAIGIIVIAVSFFIPDKDEKQTKKDTEKQREEIRRMMESELDSMKLRVNEATNETVEYGMDKCERSLDKISNEKMMALGEYATAVMDEIDKNHKEVLFLYDMLNDKQTDVKNTVRNAEAAVREISDATKNANETVANVVNSASVVKADMLSSLDEISERAQVAAGAAASGVAAGGAGGSGAIGGGAGGNIAGASYVNQNSAVNAGVGAGGVNGANGVAQQASYVNVKKEPPTSVFTSFDNSLADEDDSVLAPINTLRQQEVVEEVKEEPVDEFTELKNTTFKNVSNNNQQIILLNKEGKSVIEIAKQLNLGVGEVQLVLDLFK